MDTNGTVPWQQSPAGQHLLKTFSEEKTLHAVERLLHRIDKLEEAVGKLTELMQQGPGLAAMVGDMMDESYREADARGINIDARLKTALAMAEKLTAPEMAEKLDGLIQLADRAPGIIGMVGDMVDEGMKDAISNGFDPQTLGDTLGAMGSALTAAKQEPPASVGGVFGLFRALKDEDRQKGLGFLMNFLKQLGKRL